MNKKAIGLILILLLAFGATAVSAQRGDRAEPTATPIPDETGGEAGGRGSRDTTETIVETPEPLVESGQWQQNYLDTCAYAPLTYQVDAEGDTLVITDPQTGSFTLAPDENGMYVGETSFVDGESTITFSYVLQIDSITLMTGEETYSDGETTETCTIEVEFVPEDAQDEPDDTGGLIVPESGEWNFVNTGECAAPDAAPVSVTIAMQDDSSMQFTDVTGTNTFILEDDGYYTGFIPFTTQDGQELEIAFAITAVTSEFLVGASSVETPEEIVTCPFEMTLDAPASDDDTDVPVPTVEADAQPTPIQDVQPTPTKPPPPTPEGPKLQSGLWQIGYVGDCFSLGVNIVEGIDVGQTGITITSLDGSQQVLPEVESGVYQAQVNTPVGPVELTYYMISPTQLEGSAYNVNDYFQLPDGFVTDLCFFEGQLQQAVPGS